MITTDFEPSIRKEVKDVDKGDTVTVKTSSKTAVYHQDVCDVFDVSGGRIVCITEGGETPELILETVTDDKYVNVYTYTDGSFELDGYVNVFGSEDGSGSGYLAEDWLDPHNFLNEIQ